MIHAHRRHTCTRTYRHIIGLLYTHTYIYTYNYIKLNISNCNNCEVVKQGGLKDNIQIMTELEFIRNTVVPVYIEMIMSTKFSEKQVNMNI